MPGASDFRFVAIAGILSFSISTVSAAEFDSPLPPQLANGDQRAFPTAEGYGAKATGGRGGNVFHVTNLSDNKRNPQRGSLRHALEELSGPRTIVFDVGGVIDLESNIRILGDNVTLAGQTAPNRGVCLRGGGLVLRGDDIIVRHICTRRGQHTDGAHRDVADGFAIDNAKRVIVDHGSVSWTQDESMQTWFEGTQDITIQYSMFVEPLFGVFDPDRYAASYGPLLGQGRRQSFHHNLIVSQNRRGPRVGAESVDVVNNIVANYRSVGTHVTDKPGDGIEPRFANITNNVYVAGPDTMGPPIEIDKTNENASIYFNGNRSPTDFDTELPVNNRNNSGKLAGLARTPNARPAWAEIKQQTAQEVWKTLLDKVGARVPVLDDVDSLAIAQVTDGTAKVVDCVDDSTLAKSLLAECKTESSYGEWPFADYPTASRPAGFDTDGDGMPNAWERSHGLDPENAGDRNGDMVGDGWTNLEYYLNQLAGDYGSSSGGISGIVSGDATVDGGSLVAHWTFDESSNTNVPDATGNGNDGRMFGNPVPERVAGVFGNAMEFDGQNHIRVADFPAPQRGTILFWMKRLKITSSIQRIMGSHDGYEVKLSADNRLNNDIFAPGNSGFLRSHQAITDSNWHHVAFTFDSSTDISEIYINGQLDVRDSNATGEVLGRVTMLLGHQNEFSGSQHFQGVLDDVRVYDTVLSASEITALKNLKIYYAPRASTPPKLDGDPSEFVNVPEIRITDASRGNEAIYKAMWDDDNLYIAGVVTNDSKLNAAGVENDDPIWLDDSIETFIDSLHDGGASRRSDDYKFLVNVSNVPTDSRASRKAWDGAWSSAVRAQGNGEPK